jgi:hypothetical protein
MVGQIEGPAAHAPFLEALYGVREQHQRDGGARTLLLAGLSRTLNAAVFRNGSLAAQVTYSATDSGVRRIAELPWM